MPGGVARGVSARGVCLEGSAHRSVCLGGLPGGCRPWMSTWLFLPWRVCA